MPRVTVPDVGRVAQKWASRSAGASGDYKAGVEGTSKDWAGATVAAGQNYRTAVTAAAGAGRFEKGVTAAGTARWKAGAVTKGPGRYSEGVQVAQPEFTQKIGPVLAAIGAIDLPARLPTGSDGNIQRVALMAKGLRQLKVGR